MQRAVKVELVSNQLCLAVLQKTKSFDLLPFQISGQNQIPLNILGWNKTIIYKYYPHSHVIVVRQLGFNLKFYSIFLYGSLSYSILPLL